MVFIALVWFGSFGCKQAKGDRCEVNSDCKNGLVCNQATNTCQLTTGGGIDATVPDAPRGSAAVDETPPE
jgi:hypothetical protein